MATITQEQEEKLTQLQELSAKKVQQAVSRIIAREAKILTRAMKKVLPNIDRYARQGMDFEDTEDANYAYLTLELIPWAEAIDPNGDYDGENRAAVELWAEEFEDEDL